MFKCKFGKVVINSNEIDKTELKILNTFWMETLVALRHGVVTSRFKAVRLFGGGILKFDVPYV